MPAEFTTEKCEGCIYILQNAFSFTYGADKAVSVVQGLGLVGFAVTCSHLPISTTYDDGALKLVVNITPVLVVIFLSPLLAKRCM